MKQRKAVLPRTDRRKKRALSGMRVVTTREQPDRDLVARLRKAGAVVVPLPCIELKPLPGGGAGFLKNPLRYDWVVLSSPKGVAFFMARLTAAGRDARSLAGVHLACMGPSTRAELLKWGLRPELTPKSANQEGLVKTFQKADLRGKRVLLARAKESREVLDRALRAQGARVGTWDLYRTTVPKNSKKKALNLFARQGGADLVVFASSLAAENFYGFFTATQKKKWLINLAVASIGPVTTKAVAKLGFKVSVEPPISTLSALVEALKQWSKKKALLTTDAHR